MPLIATPSRRRLAMATLLLLAVAGAVVRRYAPNPSTLRDVGTLLLVLWLPAVGNLIAYLVQKISRRAPPPTTFAADSPFTAQVQVSLQATQLPQDWRCVLDPAQTQCIVLVASSAFTARLSRPLAQVLASNDPQTLALQFLRPTVALPQLPPGTDFHLLAGTTAVATGRVLGTGLAPAS